ncbi:MAG: nitrate reductase [Alphaproteobacteria bacterium]|nr:nitrate reductase [Alphaproteobacteria bacterium]
MDSFISFLISVTASVTAYYICKWLDRNDNGNEPKD